MQTESTNLLEWQSKFNTEQHCLEHLIQLRWPDGFICPKYAITIMATTTPIEHILNVQVAINKPLPFVEQCFKELNSRYSNGFGQSIILAVIKVASLP